MLRVEIETDNAAFSDGNGRAEVARILRDAARRIENGADNEKLRDVNGNTVGSFDLDISEETDESEDED